MFKKDMYDHPPLGTVSRVSIVINETGGYDFRVLMFVKERGTIASVDQFLGLCQVAVDSAYKFCPGIDQGIYKQYYDVIRYDPKSLRHTSYPVQRIDSYNCIFWHKLAKNASLCEKEMADVMCPACKRLIDNLNQRFKKLTSTTSEQKENRVQSSSHYPEKYLSPKSIQKKRKNMQFDRSKLLKKFSHMEVSLSEEQHDEMCELMEKVNEVGSAELESALSEADKQGVGPSIRAIWKNDLINIKKEFDQDQKRNSA